MTAVVVGLLLAATFVAHLITVCSLASRAPPKAALALLVPPLAPYWCWQLGMRRRAAAWCLAVTLYAMVRVLVAR